MSYVDIIGRCELCGQKTIMRMLEKSCAKDIVLVKNVKIFLSESKKHMYGHGTEPCRRKKFSAKGVPPCCMALGTELVEISKQASTHLLTMAQQHELCSSFSHE